jgi:flavin-dependent dehydrogenase
MTEHGALRPEYDVVIVGARAAGAATAMLLARAGLRVLAVDRGHEGTDTLSTHALMRAGVLQLHRWGLLDRVTAAGTPVIRRATFHYGEEAVPIDIKARDGVEGLYAPRRTVLDPILVEAARAAGAQVEHELALVDLLADAAGRVHGAVLGRSDGRLERVQARLVIGADGMRSRVAALVRAPAERAGKHASAVIYGHWSGLRVDGYHWYYRPGVSAGAIPTNDGRTCVFIAISPARYRTGVSAGLDPLYQTALAEAAPGLAAAVTRSELERKLHPFPGAPGFMRRAWGAGWALVGDAGYFKDPLTSHGITDALRDAELLARAIVAADEGALAAYQAARDEASLGLFEVTDRIASLAWDLDQAKSDHHLLARHMAGEAEMLLGLDRHPTRAKAASRAADARAVPMSA